MELVIKDLKAEVEGNEILHGVNLTIKTGEIAGIMGRNGSGKSTLAKVIFGHPDYTVTSGDILVDGKSILDMPTDKRAHLGIFLGFQQPHAIPGVTIYNLLRTALHSKNPGGKMENPIKFSRRLKANMKSVGLSTELFDRGVNENASGGERKKLEMIQLDMLGAKIAILDEIDSGLDIDALNTVSKSINTLRDERETGFLLITHYSRLLNLVKPDVVYVFYDGRVIKKGDASLAAQLEEEGYEKIVNSILNN